MFPELTLSQPRLTTSPGSTSPGYESSKELGAHMKCRGIEDDAALGRNSHRCCLGRGEARLSDGPMQVVTHCFEDGISLTMIVQTIDQYCHMPTKLPERHWCLKGRFQGSAKVRINSQGIDISDLFDHFLLHFRSLKQCRIQFHRNLIGHSSICNFCCCQRFLKSLGQFSHHVWVYIPGPSPRFNLDLLIQLPKWTEFG